VIQRTINGTANQVDWTFDALGRVTSEENLLGEFSYTYDGVTNRMSTATYPNGQTSTYSYLDGENDHRLQTIHHKYPNTSTLAKFDYTYDSAGNVLTWRQQADTTAVLWKYGYDPADQLISAVKHATDTPQTVLQRFAYAYDPSGNRTVEQNDDAGTLSAFDNLNRLTNQAPGGPMVIAGSLNEPGTVSISGVPVTVAASNNFRGTVPTTAGTNAFTIVAKDASGNQTTQTYEITVSGSTQTITYDANGNLNSDGIRAFEWDARNQLVAITVGTHRSEFAYDGLRRRVRMIEKTSGTVQSDTSLVWCELSICEERDYAGSTVINRSFNRGEQVGSVSYFFNSDHLGSVAAVTNSSAASVARYDFDPRGRRTLVGGVDVTSAGYTGHKIHGSSNLALAPFRALDSAIGRWLSQDPIGLRGGPNLYAYSLNNPLSHVDPLGLQCQEVTRVLLWSSSTSSITPVQPPELVNIYIESGELDKRLSTSPVATVACFWRGWARRDLITTKRWFGIFNCPDRCGNIRIEYEFYSEKTKTSEISMRTWSTSRQLGVFDAEVMAEIKCLMGMGR